MKDDSTKSALYILIFLAVIAGVVYMSVYKNKEVKEDDSAMYEEQVLGEQSDMQNVEQVEGVKIAILKNGDGEIAKSGDTVMMNYTGKLADGTVFDSNTDAKFGHLEPLIFTIDAGQVIRGWDIGILGMQIGEKRVLEIESDYAYGPDGYGPIPPNAELVFEVELLEIKE